MNVSLVEQIVKLLLSDGLYHQLNLNSLGLKHATRIMLAQIMTRQEYDGPNRNDVLADPNKVFLPVTARGARGVIEKVGKANIAGCIMDEVSKDMKELQMEEYEHIITELASVALLHKRLMAATVLNISSSAENVRVYAHCARGGGVAVAFLSLGLNNSVTATLPASLAAAPTREEFIMTAGAPLPGAKSALQSKSVLLNGKVMELIPPGGASGPPVPRLPLFAGKLVKQCAAPGHPLTIVLPPSSYGFLRFAGAKVRACAQ